MKSRGGIEAVRRRSTGHPWRFYAAGMSDGTLRALGILTAATQLADRKRAVSFVGIKEPETALHPAAAGALFGALREGQGEEQPIRPLRQIALAVF